MAKMFLTFENYNTFLKLICDIFLGFWADSFIFEEIGDKKITTCFISTQK